MLEQVLLWSINFWTTPIARGAGFLLVNKRIWLIGFQVRMSRLLIQQRTGIRLRQLLAHQPQRAVLQTLSLDILAEDLDLVAAAIANLPLLSEFAIHLGDVRLDKERRAAVLCLKMLAARSSLTSISLSGFWPMGSHDCSEVPSFSPSLRRLKTYLDGDLTTSIVQRCTSLQALSVYVAGPDIPIVPWGAVADLRVSVRYWNEYMPSLIKSQLEESIYYVR